MYICIYVEIKEIHEMVKHSFTLNKIAMGYGSYIVIYYVTTTSLSLNIDKKQKKIEMMI